MTYLSYIKDKLKVSEISLIIEEAVKYLSNTYPIPVDGKPGREIVDEWIQGIMGKWNIECEPFFLSQKNLFGKLEPREHGFTLTYNKQLEYISSQKRFVIAHELAHILSFNTNTNYPEYAVIHSYVEEYLCDRIARELLLPKSLVNLSSINLKQLQNDDVKKLEKISMDFDVSIWQIIRKIIEDHRLSDIIAIYWKYQYKIDERKNDVSHLKVIDFYRPAGFFIPLSKEARVSSPLKRVNKSQPTSLPFVLGEKERVNIIPRNAFIHKTFVQGKDVVHIGSVYKKTLFTSAFFLEKVKDSYVIQIIQL